MPEELNKLKEKKDKYITKIFWLCLQIAFIFGIPAVGGAFLSRFLKNKYPNNDYISTLVLFGCFIFSWVIVIIYFNYLKKKLKKINNQIEKIKSD
jgi:uncharacterized membrane protein (DUF485 family)